ncbi:hypothetical protein TNCV_4369731 [Trichonephila clavipes]|nr:hypothetical protein TNCV_4369731 [Trichonephila clavipes]
MYASGNYEKSINITICVRPSWSGQGFHCDITSTNAVWYRDEVLNPTVKLHAPSVGISLVSVDDNARPPRAIIVDDFLESEKIAGRE